MIDRSTFLRAICERPHDDQPRLVYADWLDEQGDPRGELIRVQVELARDSIDDASRAALVHRQNELLAQHRTIWDAELPPRCAIGDYVRGFPVVTIGHSDGQSFLRACERGQLFASVPSYHLDLDTVRRAEVAVLAQSPWLARLTGLGCSNEGWLRGVLAGLFESPYLSNLTALRLAGHCHGAESVRALAAAPHLGRLITLDLRGNGLASDDVAALAEIPHLGRVASLWLGNSELEENFIGAPGARALAESPCFSHLNELVLQRNPIGDEGGLGLVGADWPRLAFLHLGRCRLGPEAATALVEAGGLAALQGLDLSGNDLGDLGAIALASCPGLNRLRTLDLSDNNIGEDGASALLASPYLNGITELNLDGNRGMARLERYFQRRFGDRFRYRIFGYL